ncbi:hypothetical protein AgCh_036608 [Apium graveolens]
MSQSQEILFHPGQTLGAQTTASLGVPNPIQVPISVDELRSRIIPTRMDRIEDAGSMENQTVNDPMNMTVDPNAQITGSDGVHQQPINPNARIVQSDGGQTHVGHVPSGHVPVGHTVIG